MLKISVLKKSAAALALLSLAPVVFATAAAADNPPAKARPAGQGNPEAMKLKQAAIQALRQGNLSLATIQLKNAMRLDPDNGTLRVQLGFVLLQGGDASSAEREIRQGRMNGAKDEDAIPPLMQAMIMRQEYSDVLAQFPEPAPNDKSKLAGTILRARAEALQMTNNFPAAIASMDRALAIQRDVPGLLARARLSILQNQNDVGMGFIDQALKLSPGNPTGLMMKASVIRTHDKAAALAIIDTLLKAHPEATAATIARIEMLLDMRRFAEAKKDDDALLAKQPSLPIGLFYKAVLLGLDNKAVDAWRIAQSLPSEFIQSNQRIVQGVTQLAVSSGNIEIGNQMLTTYLGQHPSNDEVRMRLAALRMQMKNTKDALEIMKPLMNSNNADALQLISAIYTQQGQSDIALDYMRKAANAGSSDKSLQLQVAMADIAQKRTSQGVQELLDIMKKRPGYLDPALVGVEMLARQSKYAEAQQIADQVDKDNPKSAVPPFLRGQILFSQHKFENSLPFFNLSLQRDPHFMPALFARADVLMGQQKYPDATKDLKLAQSIQPNNPLSYIKLAEIAAIQKQPAQSIAILRQAIARAPKIVVPRLVLARYQVSQRQFPDALATLKDTLKIAPNDGQTIALMGQVQQAMGQKAAAVTTNTALTQKFGKSGVAQSLLANSLLANGDKKGALEAMKRAVQLDPDVRGYSESLINLQLDAGDKDGAVVTARAWAGANKGPDGTSMLAQTLARAGRLPEAASVIAKAQEIRPDWQLTVMEAQIDSLRGDKAKALSVLKNWLSDHSTDLAVRQAYADALLTAQDNAGALAQYEIFLKSRDDIPAVLNNVAWLLREKNPARALTLATKAVKLQPNSPDVADTLGMLYLDKKDAKSALPVLQRAHAFGPQNGQISYHLAMAYNSLGQKADAKKTLQDALAKGANFTDAADAKKLLQQL